MSTKANFENQKGTTFFENLKGAILNHWKEDGVYIADQTAVQMAEEVASKMKAPTLDELRLALSELKLDLNPTEARTNDMVVTAKSVISKSIDALHKVGGFGGATREEVEMASKEIINLAKRTGNSIKQEREEIQKRKKRTKRLRETVYNKINAINNFEDDSEDSQKEILDLVANNPQLQELVQKEYEALPYDWGAGGPVQKHQLKGPNTSEVNKIGYTPENIQALNEAFGGGKGKNPFMIQAVDQRKKVTDRLLWTRKRFAFERAIGNADKPLYAKKLGFYQAYVTLYKRQAAILTEAIQDMDRIMVSTRKQTNKGKVYVTKVVEHLHSKSVNKDALEDAQAVYEAEVRKYAEEKAELGSDSVEYEKIQRELDQLAEKEETEPVLTDSGSMNFDPEFIYGLGKKGGKAHQQATIAPNVWSITPEGSVAANPLEDTDISWKYGHALYDYLDTYTKETERDVNDVLKKYEEKKKVDQKFAESPYATEEQIADFEEREESYVNGWTREKKRKMSQSTANWAYLWNLAKQNVGKGYRPKDDSYKKIITPNDRTIRNNVIGNKNTPDWILMFMAETDTELGNTAENMLGRRGWVVDKVGKEPEISNEFGTWKWKPTKPRRASSLFSRREAVKQNPMQPLLDEQAQIAQERTELANKEMANPDQDFTQERESLRTRESENSEKINRSYAGQLESGSDAMGQQTSGYQGAGDNTTAPTPKIPEPPVIPIPAPQAPATASKTWGNMFRK